MKNACATISVIALLVSPAVFAKGDAKGKATENSNQLDAHIRTLPIHDGMTRASLSTKAHFQKVVQQTVAFVLDHKPDVIPPAPMDEPSDTAR